MRKDIASEAHGTSLSRQGACSQSYSYSTLSCRSHEAPRSRHAMRMDADGRGRGRQMPSRLLPTNRRRHRKLRAV